MRSMPGAMPPCGGAPSESARSMPPNFSSSTFSRIAGDREGLAHHVGPVVADRAGRQLDAVADDVVLKRLDDEDLVLVLGSSARNSSTGKFGIENGLCEKSIFFSSSFHSNIGKSTIQQNSKRSFVDEVELLADFGARRRPQISRSSSACRRRRSRRRRRQAQAGRRSAWCAPGRCSWRAGRRRPLRLRARRCSQGPAGPRLAPSRIHAVAEGAVAAALAPESPRPAPSGHPPECWRKS